MKKNIKKIQLGLNGIVEEKINISFIKDYAHILIFALPVHSLLYLIPPYSSFLYTILSWTDAVCYIASLIGLLICFAKNSMKKIAIYFFLSAVPSIINVFKGYSFNISTIIYIAFYIVLAVCALRYDGNAVSNDIEFTYQSMPDMAERKCRKCGNTLRENASFCSVCGRKIK